MSGSLADKPAKIRLCPLLSKGGQTLVRLLGPLSANSGHPQRICSHENRKTASQRSFENSITL